MKSRQSNYESKLSYTNHEKIIQNITVVEWINDAYSRGITTRSNGLKKMFANKSWKIVEKKFFENFNFSLVKILKVFPVIQYV